MRTDVEKPAEENIHTQERPSSEGKVVLVVDDNADLLSLNRTILEMDGFKVFTVLGGEEALALLAEISQPDLILLDMRMEDMSGLEFLEVLEERRPEIIENVPVVFLTAMDKVPPSKAVGFIRKPIDLDKFVVAVHQFIEKGTDRPRYKH
jgi:two-component system response regulator AtoC